MPAELSESAPVAGPQRTSEPPLPHVSTAVAPPPPPKARLPSRRLVKQSLVMCPARRLVANRSLGHFAWRHRKLKASGPMPARAGAEGPFTRMRLRTWRGEVRRRVAAAHGSADSNGHVGDVEIRELGAEWSATSWARRSRYS